MPKLVDHDKRREELADAALQIIAREGMRGVTTRAVADEEQWVTAINVVEQRFGRLNGLVNNAGVTADASLRKMQLSQ